MGNTDRARPAVFGQSVNQSSVFQTLGVFFSNDLEFLIETFIFATNKTPFIMNRGKHKCETLKKIRQMIADRNGIDYHTTECKFQGNCSGTCPKCEAELRYLEDQLRRKESAGKKVAVAGLALGISLVTSCGPCNPEHRPFALEGDVPMEVDSVEVSDSVETDTITACQVKEPSEPKKSKTAKSKAPATEEWIEPLEGDVVRVDDSITICDEEYFADIEGIEVDETDYFMGLIVGELPEFPGGEDAFAKYIDDNKQYPIMALENDIQGTVYVQFVIDEEGNVINPEILRGVDPLLDKEALRVVGSSPKWKPAKMGGKLVRANLTVPVKFQLPE